MAKKGKNHPNILSTKLIYDGEDRLSSLPDSILTKILSLLPIKCAASTSVLSHRWRHLWTTVTCLDLSLHNYVDDDDDDDNDDDDDDTLSLTDSLSNILQHLTSPKLYKIKIQFDSSTSSLDPDFAALESCFLDISHRNVEEFIFIDITPEAAHIRTPDCFLHSHSLVMLYLAGPLAFDFNGIELQLPNLKKLSLINLSNVPDWVWSLYKSAPLLEDLTLVFEIKANLPPIVISPLNVFFPNLKSLTLALVPGINQVYIDAPNLTHLVINGCALPYSFRCIPTALVKAGIELKREKLQVEDENDAEDFQWLSEFFRGISSITNLEIVWFRSINIFYYLKMHLPEFSNVVRLEVTLDGSDFGGWNDLLVSLQCFPNLEHLQVTFEVMGFVDELVQTMWRAPKMVPSCLIDKLNMIKIVGLPISVSAAGIKLLRYILRNAKVLRKVYLDAWFDKHSPEEELWEERTFCKSLFKLPRSSPICEVVFSGRFIRSSSKTFKKRKLTCTLA